MLTHQRQHPLHQPTLPLSRGCIAFAAGMDFDVANIVDVESTILVLLTSSPLK